MDHLFRQGRAGNMAEPDLALNPSLEHGGGKVLQQHRIYQRRPHSREWAEVVQSVSRSSWLRM